MYDLDCPICMNSFKVERIRSLPCGHTYCSPCVDKLIHAATCPECRHEFEPDDVRRLFIKPSASANNPRSQLASSSRRLPAEERGFIAQAKHIARRLRKMDANSPAQSVKIAADVIEEVATIQCKEAQEIVWKAVREFWLRLVVDFEQLEICKDFQQNISSLEQRMEVLDETCSRLLLEVETERNRVQHYMNMMQGQTQEIEKLKVAVGNAGDEKQREVERQHVLIARLRASEIKHRAQIKQLKKDLKSREAEAAISRPQLEDESLVIEPDIAYDEARSYRLDIYNESPPSKRRKLSPEANSHADSFDYPLSAGDFSTPPPEPQPQPREGTGQSHQATQPELDLLSPPQRPRFGSDWNLSRQRQRQKLTAMSNSGTLPFPVDAQGMPKTLLKYGPRVRVKIKTR